jgi:hypothetical protein
VAGPRDLIAFLTLAVAVSGWQILMRRYAFCEKSSLPSAAITVSDLISYHVRLASENKALPVPISYFSRRVK